MRMTLARKGSVAHVQEVKVESEITEAWLVNDAKALGIIAQGVELQHQTKIRSATRAIQAWGTLREFYNRTTLQKRVAMTRRLHEFKVDDGASMVKHLDAFDELAVGLQTMGEPVDEARQRVVLLSSLPVEYELISSIIENSVVSDLCSPSLADLVDVTAASVRSLADSAEAAAARSRSACCCAQVSSASPLSTRRGLRFITSLGTAYCLRSTAGGCLANQSAYSCCSLLSKSLSIAAS
ncbi:unnamed protein product [Phytophthora fragariaefolia]|uniref:Unnamed protein product n=1 Tax=Phytophthora fragariaefolia TaxID=1490495 RepID=A0A9W6YAL7_9STRA|nr:unnamed protein product [Phytophthora fragariaefolia]